MKTNIEVFVCDWNSNGTNDVMFIKDGEFLEFGLDEVTFGIDINKYDPIEFDGIYGAVVPLKYIVANLAVSPVRTSAQSYKRLMQALNA